ncbi:Gfo/Idh/MocA family protein [Novipirellula artificiosorum]|uniref:Glycosyl hydrolase n=1 Tax=Novipirellula artificiosorum TaxID=2528016 RepID=A0A5C6CWJ7_9BACT|nr:Gfo/Idh/MocA family oxidoreductase [Novipirellula artificiosorum]TWU28940.1 Glycosyl hydrolase [Novipirellula artificiosorum]
MNPPQNKKPSSTSRRGFLKDSMVLSAASTVGGLALSRSAHAAGSDVLRIGLIGCGGRGCGAANNIMAVYPGARLVAMADLFEDRLEAGLKSLSSTYPDQVDVAHENRFDGFDGYERLLETDIDVVLIAAASHFHPEMTRAAVEAGKHVFTEKPHGIDVPGAKRLLEACDLAKEKNLAMVSGLCWRYSPHVREAIQHVHNGMIGEVVAIQENYLSQPYVKRPRQPEWSELEYQFRNWYHFNWLSGDQTSQQLIHSLDKASWVLGDVPPLKAWGLGGRQVCTSDDYGDQFDSHAIVYEYETGQKVFAFCHDRPDCYSATSDIVYGTKGRLFMPRWNETSITDLKGNELWKYKGENVSMVENEQRALVESILSGNPINNRSYMFTSTMLGILGQMACYTGQEVTWEMALGSTLDFRLKEYKWDAEAPIAPRPDGTYPTAMPGITKFS